MDRLVALTACQLGSADSMSLKAMGMPAALEPGPLVTRCRSLTVAKIDSIGLVVRRCIQSSAGRRRTSAAHRGRRWSSRSPLATRAVEDKTRPVLILT